MKTIKIYNVFCFEAPMMSQTGQHFSLAPWGHNTIAYKGESDNGTDYILPDGYSLVTPDDMSAYLADENGFPVRILNVDDAPMIAGCYGLIKLEVA